MDDTEAARIVGSGMTVSDKIRALDAAGYPRAQIARLLGKRYQHVRNVLEAEKLRRGSAAPSGMAEEGPAFLPAGPSPYGPDVQARGRGVYRLVVRADGSIVLPREVRDAFGVAGGGAVMARLDGEEFKLVSGMTALRRAQELVRRYIPGGVDLVGELIAERRREAEREDRE